MRLEIATNLLPFDPEKRTNKTDPLGKLPCPRHARQPVQACPAQDAMQNRFRLIITGMADSHMPSTDFTRHFSEKVVPHPPRSCL